MMMDPETKKIKELFMERPIWSRHALIERSGIRAANLKKILPYIAFYWSTCPWKQMWHRLEQVFDPRIEKNSWQKASAGRYKESFNLDGYR